jgi:hypothetical protein
MEDITPGPGRPTLMKNKPLVAGVALLALAAVALAMVNTAAIYVDVVVFFLVGCFALVKK